LHLRGQRKGRTRKRVLQRPAPGFVNFPAHRAESELSMTAGHSDVNLNIIVVKGIQICPKDGPNGILGLTQSQPL